MVIEIPAEYDNAPIVAIMGFRVLILRGDAREDSIRETVLRGGIESYLGLKQLVHWSAHLIVSEFKDDLTEEEVKNARSWLEKLGPYRIPQVRKENGVVTEVRFVDP